MNPWTLALGVVMGVVGLVVVLFVWALMAVAKRSDERAAEIEWPETADGVRTTGQRPVLFLIVNDEPADLSDDALRAAIDAWRHRFGDDHDD